MNRIKLWLALLVFISISPTQIQAQISTVDLCFEDFFDYRGEVYFCGEHRNLGRELFRSNGTREGTAVVADIDPGPGGSSPRNYFLLNGYLYFFAENTRDGWALWRTGGDENTTKIIKRFGPELRAIDVVLQTGKEVFFLYEGYINSSATLWKTDGTADGTIETAASVTLSYTSSSSYWPASSFYYDEDRRRLYYASFNQVHRLDIDNDIEQTLITFPVEDKYSQDTMIAQLASSPSKIIALNEGNVWYLNGGFDGAEQITSDAYYRPDPKGRLLGLSYDSNTAKTSLYAIVNNKPRLLDSDFNDGNIYPEGIHNVNSIFKANGGNTIWTTDFTASGTKNLFTSEGSLAENIVDLGNNRTFFADQTNGIIDLYVTNGTAGGTRSFKTIDGERLIVMGEVNGTTLFATRRVDPALGHRAPYTLTLWRTDGTTGGTRQIYELIGDNYYTVSNMFVEGNRLYFITGYSKVWHTDGTSAGTYSIKYGSALPLNPIIDLLLEDER